MQLTSSDSQSGRSRKSMVGSEGSTFGKFVLLTRLSTGRNSELFLARQRGPLGFKKLVAIKRALQTGDQRRVEAFVAEARAAAQFSHPHIAQVHELGQTGGVYYLAMEYVNGKTLRQVLDRGRRVKRAMHPEHVASLIGDLCAALQFAHNATDMFGTEVAVIHRDVNPTNLIVSYGGDLKLIDFGSARSDSSDLTEVAPIERRVAYLSPEQVAARDLDKRSDIFSVGVVMYEMLTGQNPYSRPNPLEAMEAIRTHEPPLPSTFNPKLKPFDRILTRALEKDRNDRYSECLELAEDLRKLVRTGRIEPAPRTLGNYMTALFDADITRENEVVARSVEESEMAFADGSPARNMPMNDEYTEPRDPHESRPTLIAKDIPELRRESYSRTALLATVALAAIIAVIGTVLITRSMISNGSDAEADAKAPPLEAPLVAVLPADGEAAPSELVAPTPGEIAVVKVAPTDGPVPKLDEMVIKAAPAAAQPVAAPAPVAKHVAKARPTAAHDDDEEEEVVVADEPVAAAPVKAAATPIAVQATPIAKTAPAAAPAPPPAPAQAKPAAPSPPAASAPAPAPAPPPAQAKPAPPPAAPAPVPKPADKPSASADAKDKKKDDHVSKDWTRDPTPDLSDDDDEEE